MKTERTKKTLVDFYREIDQLRSRSSCSVWMVMLCLGIILLCLVAVLWDVRKNHTQSYGGITRLSFVRNTQEVSTPEKIVADNIITVKIREQQLAEIIKVTDSTFPIKSANIQIEPKGIAISGRTSTNILSLRITVYLIPRVDRGKLIFDLGSIQAGGISAPKTITDNIGPALLDTVNKVPLTDGITQIEKVELQPGVMEIVGKPQAQ